MSNISAYGSITVTDLLDTATYIYYSATNTSTLSSWHTSPQSNDEYIGIYSGPPTDSGQPANPTSAIYSAMDISKYVGDDGISVTNVRELYWLKTNSTNPSQITWNSSTSQPSQTIYSTDRQNSWTSMVPTYITNGTYYTCIETSLSDGTKVWSAPVVNQALTNTNSNATSALGQITNLDNRLKTFFWPGDSSYSGAFAVSTDSITKTDANTYGFNTRVATGLVSVGYNKIPLSEWGINEGLKMYYPILDNGEIVNNKLGMQLLTNSLTFYKVNNSSDKALEINNSSINLYRDNSNKALEVNTNGINLYGSSTSTADATLTTDGLKLAKGGIIADARSITEAQNMSTFESERENVSINSLIVNLEADMEGKNNIDIIHTNKNIAILPPSLLAEDTVNNGITWHATSNSSFHVSGTATAQSDSIPSRDYGGITNGNLRFLSKGTYTITATKEGTGGGYIHLRGFTSNNTTYRTLVTLSQWNTPQTFTLEDDAFYLIRGRVAADAVVDYEVTIQIEKGTEGTTYIENQYELKTIFLEEKVYKGILDVKKGILTITHQIFNVNFAGATGTQAGGSSTNYKGFYSNIVPNVKKPANQEVPDMYCNRFTVTSRYENYRNTEGIAIHQSEGRAYVYSTAISSMTLTEARTWLEDNPIQIIYPLESPETIQIDVTDIITFEGVNNIWSNSGTTILELGDFIYLSTEDFGSYTMNGSTFSDWREIIGPNFGIRVDGSLYATNVNVSGVINAESGSFRGKINAESGSIGGFTIGNNELYSETKTGVTSFDVGAYIGPLGFNISGGTKETTTYFTPNAVSIGGLLSWTAGDDNNDSNLTIYATEIILGDDVQGNQYKVKTLLNEAIEANIKQAGDISNNYNSIKNINDFLNDYYKPYITTVENTSAGYIQLKRKSNNNASSIKITDGNIEISINQNVITTFEGQLMKTNFGEFENLRMKANTYTSNSGYLTWIARSDGHLSLKVVN